jgi:hypothetical protein
MRYLLRSSLPLQNQLAPQIMRDMIGKEAGRLKGAVFGGIYNNARQIGGRFVILTQ